MVLVLIYLVEGPVVGISIYLNRFYSQNSSRCDVYHISKSTVMGYVTAAVFWCFCIIPVAAGKGSKRLPVPVIFDTDYGPFIDDGTFHVRYPAVSAPGNAI